jgi:hypothetical protein
MPSVFNDVLDTCVTMTDSANIGSTTKEGFGEVKLGLDYVIQVRIFMLGRALHRHVPDALWYHLGATIISKALHISIP